MGLDFVHFNGMSGEIYFLEMTGQGLALLDWDHDGDLDVYYLQGHMLGEGKTLEDATIAPKYPEPFTDRLYRNDSTVDDNGKPVIRFQDVTELIGLQAYGYGQGAATGDFNNDGWVDLYVTNWKSNQMLMNNGDGTFEDVTAETGTDDTRWSVSAAFFDLDRDGWLDLFVTNYVDFRYATHKVCTTMAGAANYCAPGVFGPLKDSLFRNRGDGTFENISKSSGIDAEIAAGLGVVTNDFNGDGWVDIYVANDAFPNQLWINQRDGTLFNDALIAGCAVNDQGMPEGSMGVVAGDIDGDGSQDLFMAHIVEQTNTLYLNDGSGIFREATRTSGLGLPSFKYTGFGTALFDFDNDGWLDLFVGNGAVQVIQKLVERGDIYPIHQPDTLYQNLGGGRFEEVTDRAGAFIFSEVSRGVAHGDIDNDGDSDLVLANNAGPARLFRNDGGQDAHWLGLRLLGGHSLADVPNAKVRVVRGDNFTAWRRSGTHGSYAAASDPRLLIGLAEADRVKSVRVDWPDGRKEEWRDLPVDRLITLPQGTR
ncbi:MAG: CRTAC1 family protein [Thermoanaerobaculia bacterium]